MTRITKVLMFTLIFALLAGCSETDQGKSRIPEQQIELTVSAAASLQNALQELQKEYEARHPNVKLLFNFGGSGTLQRQLEQGAPADLFFSADESKFNMLVNQGIIDKKHHAALLKNELVLIVPKSADSPASFEELTEVKQLALGAPEFVPAGKYAKETLMSMQIWDEISSKVIPAKDVRQVLSYVETKNVDAGIVYKTDALASHKVKAVATADSNFHSPIVYPLGVVKTANHLEEATKFYDFLLSAKSKKVFEKYGFTAD
jgi:molybdate transport system substrate-binding protein